MEPNRRHETSDAAPRRESPPRTLITDPNFNLPVKPISELVMDADFPRSAMGQHIDIGGYPGVVVEIVKSSIKVRSADGTMMSYNYNALRRLYGPKPEAAAIRPSLEPAPEAAKPQVKRDIILTPNFEAPVIPIEDLVGNPDFPQCAFGQFIDLHGYSGVAIEIVGRSLKVRSREGSTRSYNADGLRKLYTNTHAGVMASLSTAE
jgi:hypothetical protein